MDCEVLEAPPAVSYLDRFFADVPSAFGCSRCRQTEPYLQPLQMAFQPIVDVRRREVFAYEALVRGAQGESAGAVIAGIRPGQVYAFDQTCRVLAIDTAQRLGITTRLSINFMPNAVYDPSTCIRLTLAAAEKVGFPTERLILELSEAEQIRQPEHVLKIMRDYQRRGFLTAIDDFGAGYSGLNLLAQVQPQLVKLDMALTRNIDRDPVRHAIVDGVLRTCTALGSEVVAEGIETEGELVALRRLGVRLFQGYLLAHPQTGVLPRVDEALYALSD